MTGLALRSLRHRATAFTATFIAVFLGTAMIGSFATLIQTSTGPLSSTDSETLVIMGAVVGGWGALMVLFSVASTLAITVRQREVEIGLLRTVGTTPRQARRLIRVEALVVTILAALAGSAVAALGGRGLLAMLRNGGLVADDVAYGGGVASLAAAAAGIVLTSMLAASIAGRRATSGSATVALAEGSSDIGRMRWWRVAAALVLIGYGLVMGVVTITVSADSADPYDAMATSGSCSILVGVGLALLAPLLLRWLSALARPVLSRSGATGHLAAYNTSRRAHLLSGVLGPVIVLTASSIGTLMLVGADGRTLADGVSTPETDTINLLNNVVVGMISLFAAIMVVNSFAAVISHRRAELNRLWLLGATPGQVQGSVLAEAWVIAGVGVVVGAVAALATIIPFGVARDEGIVPDGQLWLPPLLVVGIVLLTLLSARSAVRRVAPAATTGQASLR
jgi:putative ABC transport system permease protein